MKTKEDYDYDKNNRCPVCRSCHMTLHLLLRINGIVG
jgi:hypothetical protein